ncbi:MAG: hypothetical protein IIZ33_00835, partial [Erysipelotrichaceae bacterium]|nr:hypothetical protein [Erysipelotrichaceae bacterium]
MKPPKSETFFDRLLKYRILIAAGVFFLCLLFHVHGSSLGMYYEYLPTVTDEAVKESYHLFGKDRSIRSDEWAIHTPLYLSQEANDYGLYSSQMGIGEVNMVLDYYAPVKHIITLGKPLNWGYLLFGSETGLSWYWCGQVILFFLLGYEVCSILTRRNTRLSVLGSFLIALSPAIQWWMIPHVPIVILYAMALFTFGYYLFKEGNILKRILWTALLSISLIGFIFSIFPSAQVLSGLTVFFLLLACLYRDREELSLNRSLLFCILAVILIAGGISASFLYSSLEDFKALLNTSYPGRRISLGGNWKISDLFTHLYSIFLAFKDTNVSNNSEVATFIHFAPLFFLLYPRLRNRGRNRKDMVPGAVLCILLFVVALFMCVGFPEWLAKITLFSYVNRVKVPFGFAAVLLTVWAMDRIEKEEISFALWERILYPLAYGAVMCLFLNEKALAYLTVKYAVLEIVFFVLVLFLLFSGYRRLTVLSLCALMVFAGGFVNPLCRGISPITNHPLSDTLQEIREEDPEARFLCVDDSWPITEFLLANGVKTINATNFYPAGDY